MKQRTDHVQEYELARASGSREAVVHLFAAWRAEIWRVTCFGTWFQGTLVDIREENNAVSFGIAVEEGEVTLTIEGPFQRFKRKEVEQ